MPSRKILALGESWVEGPTDRKALVKLLSAIRRVRLAFSPAMDPVSQRGGLHNRAGKWYVMGYQPGGFAWMSVDLDQVTLFPSTSAYGDQQPAAAYRRPSRAPRSNRTTAGDNLPDLSADLTSIVTHRIIGDRVI